MQQFPEQGRTFLLSFQTVEAATLDQPLHVRTRRVHSPQKILEGAKLSSFVPLLQQLIDAVRCEPVDLHQPHPKILVSSGVAVLAFVYVRWKYGNSEPAAFRHI